MRRGNRGGHLEGCLQRLSHHREITWTVLKRLGLRVFEIRTRLQIGPLFVSRETAIRHIGREHTLKRSKRSLRGHACGCCVPNSRDSACRWTSARSCSWRTPLKRSCQSLSHPPSTGTRPIVSPPRRCRPACRRPSVRRCSSHLRRLRGPSASCTVEGQPWVPDGSTVGPRFLGGNRGFPHKNRQPWHARVWTHALCAPLHTLCVLHTASSFPPLASCLQLSDSRCSAALRGSTA